MSFTTRAVLVLMLMLPVTGRLSAQEANTTTAAETGTSTAVQPLNAATTTDAAPAEPAAKTTEPAAGPSSYTTREKFGNVLRRYPPELGTILSLDPTLLSNDAFLAEYPNLAAFISENPEVRRNPRFYLRGFGLPEPASNNTVIDEIFEALSIAATFILIAFALAWMIRTIVEQKRWNRLSRTQSEVHNKILDRFGSSEELLQYIRTPAGSKFLEAAPIPLRAERSTQHAPLTRIIWSIQLGVVVGAASLGMILVSLRLDREASVALFSMGVIAFCIGAGFIGSAYASMLLSRRLGIWQGQGEEQASPEDPGLVR